MDARDFTEMSGGGSSLFCVESTSITNFVSFDIADIYLLFGCSLSGIYIGLKPGVGFEDLAAHVMVGQAVPLHPLRHDCAFGASGLGGRLNSRPVGQHEKGKWFAGRH
jgi:hypothetical protein